MTTDTILLYAFGVFGLMVVGIFLTMIEFNRLSEEPSVRKGDGSSKDEFRRHDANQPASSVGQTNDHVQLRAVTNDFRKSA